MNSLWTVETFQTTPLDDCPDSVFDRQERIPGFSTAKLQSHHLVVIGAGGIAGPVVTGAARKGIAVLSICDDDTVESDNLNRQHFFARDLYLPKAICLARNAAAEGFGTTKVIGHHVAFDEETATVLGERADVVVCAVDNHQTRALASRYFRARGVPVIHAAVSEDASYGWVFVEVQDGPCVACVQPRIATAEKEPRRCTPSPACLDILRSLSGLILYAVDSLLMDRPRHWNYRSINLQGGSPDLVTTATVRPDCPLCQKETT